MENLLMPVIAIIGGTLGMLMHILKRKVKGETLTSVINYFKYNFKYTTIAFITMLGSIWTIYSPEGDWYKLLAACLTAGYMSDSVMNKDEDL